MNILVEGRRHELKQLHLEWTRSLLRTGQFGSPITTLVEGPPMGEEQSYIVAEGFARFLSARKFLFRAAK
jgi:hypothetical protein